MIRSAVLGAVGTAVLGSAVLGSAVLGSAAIGSAAIGSAAIGATPAFAAHAQPLTDHSVSVTVQSVSPSSLAPTTSNRPFKVTLLLDNSSDQSLDHVRIDGDRGNPINSQQALDAAIKSPQPPDPNLIAHIKPFNDTPVTADLPAHGTATVTFTTLTSLGTESGICVCANAIYPLYFTVHYTDSAAGDVTVGSGQTYVPAFQGPLEKLRVSWVWPILDRPHRLADDSVFLDDDLASSVSNGRLDRVLSIVENVASTVPMTLVIDPDLVDELAVMASGNYQVRVGPTLVKGTGGAAAADWLSRLRTVLAQYPSLDVQFTSYADPAVESLTENGLTWSDAMSSAEQTRVEQALGGRTPRSDVAWPVGESAGAQTIAQLHSHGASTVLLSDQLLPSPAQPTPDAIVPVQTITGTVEAAVTSSAIQSYVPDALSSLDGASVLPKLVAQVAVRVAEDPTVSHYVVIAAPRYVDPSAFAAQAIRDTAATSWSSGMTVDDAAVRVTPVARGQLVAPRAPPQLPSNAVSTAFDVRNAIPALSSMFDPSTASALLGTLPNAVQRIESSAWTTSPALSDTFSAALAQVVSQFRNGVFIVRPSTGTYTLASNNSPLPLTVENDLDAPVRVHLSVSTVNGLPGFSAGNVGVQTIAPHSKQTVHVPINVQRTGRFRVQAVLTTPLGEQLGSNVQLSIHSTALGTIGVVITVVAAAVLVLALLVRFVRRMRRRRSLAGTAPESLTPAPAGMP